VAADLLTARLHRALASADAADAARWCTALAKLLKTSPEVAAAAAPALLKNDAIGALLGVLRLGPPHKPSISIGLRRSAATHSVMQRIHMQREALDALAAFSCSTDLGLLAATRNAAARLGATRCIVHVLHESTSADPRDDPCEDDPRVPLSSSALRTLCFVAGASGGGGRSPFGCGENAQLVEELQRIVEFGGAGALERAADFGLRNEHVAYRVALLLEHLSKPIVGLAPGVPDHAAARAERLASDGAADQALHCMKEHPSSLRVQLCGLRLVGNLTIGAATAGSGAATRA
jgi:hypothetical protein